MTTAVQRSTDQHSDTVHDQAGTAPGDRRFRPDIQGLRAVAVALVVFYHAGLSPLSGGYIGVDVFFVISGFVITGLLLRERTAAGRTSLLDFYGRRCRRIIPAATVVIVATVVMTYIRLGVVYGTLTATAARWTAVFLANFHFAAVGTNYLTAQQPPSPLLNFWSLAVEEQFYLVYPTVFLLIAALRSRWTLRARLAVGLVVVVAGSFALSVLQTASHPTVAYFSPFTRAWELAIGALVAVGTDWLLTLPKPVATSMTWIGMAAVAYGALAFSSHTAYPGSLVAIPVVGTALVIAGGTSTPPAAVEWVLRRRPFQWVGQLSYSIYLWHWPLLVIAAEAAGQSRLPFRRNIGWLVVALAAAALSYYLVENPLRHARFRRYGRMAPIGLGVVLTAVSLVVATIELDVHQGSTAEISVANEQAAATATVAALVSKSTAVRTLPVDLTPPLARVNLDWGGPPAPCWPAIGQTTIPACIYGDRTSDRTMVIYGDSHAGMWLQTLTLIATLARWKLVYLGKGDCPADMLSYQNPSGFGKPGGEYAVCDAWHRFALNRIRQLHPDLLIITQEIRGRPDGDRYTDAQWQSGLERTFTLSGVDPGRIVVLGNVPLLPQSPALCLSRHPDDIQVCAGPIPAFEQGFSQAEAAAAAAVGAHYVSTTPWFCAQTCPAVIGKYLPYWDRYHITAAYSDYLALVLANALDVSAAPAGSPTSGSAAAGPSVPSRVPRT